MSETQLAHYRRRAAAVGFRSATLRGVSPAELRAAVIGHSNSSRSTVGWAIAGTVALGGGFFLGRWWARRQRATTVRSNYDAGLDALAVGR